MNELIPLPKRIKNLEIKTKILVEELISGAYHSAFKGRGIEFSDVREYHYGDDIRLIDWNVTARLNKPFIKTFQEERELSLIVAIDVSSSTLFGAARNTRELMTEVSSIFCFSAIKNNDMVGEVIFSDKINKYLPPKSGNINVIKIIKDILTYEKTKGKTNLQKAIKFINRLRIKKSIILLMSDFIDENYEKELKVLTKKHDIIPIIFEDELTEKLFRKDYPLLIKDIETGNSVIFDSSTALEFEKLRKKRYKIFSDLGIDYIKIKTDQSPLSPIIDFFQKRSKLY